MRIVITFTLLLVAVLPPSAQAAAGHKAHVAPLPYGTWVRYHQHHMVWPDGRIDDRSGWLVTFPVRVVNRSMVVPKTRHTPAKRAPKKAAASRRAAAPRGRSGYYWVTGYSWGCGTPNGRTAHGTIPYVGTVANDWLPFGTRIFVPSLGYYGVVLDRGQGMGGFDLFAPNCAVTYAYTGQRLVTIY